MFTSLGLLILAVGMILIGCCILRSVMKTIVTSFPEITDRLGGQRNVYLMGYMLIIASLLVSFISW